MHLIPQHAGAYLNLELEKEVGGTHLVWFLSNETPSSAII